MSAAAVIDHRDPVTRMLGVFVLCVSLLIGWLYYEGKHEAERSASRDREVSEYNRLVTECQARFNSAVVKNITARSQLSAREARLASQETAAQRELIQAVGRMMRQQSLPPRAAARREATQDIEMLRLFDRYDEAVTRQLAAAAALQKYRENNPLPVLPDCSVTANLVLRDAGVATVGPSYTPTP